MAEARTDAGLVTLAVPCRTDEPALGRTLAAALDSWRTAGAGPLEVLVCLNGGEPARALAELRALATAAGAPLAEVDVDAPGAAPPPPATTLGVTALLTRRAGKPIAWNLLRTHARGAYVVFVDADVSFSPDAFAALLAALGAAPGAVIASARTTCAPRPGAFEAIMAVPYAADFPNLSPQLYAARTAALPQAMPDDLIEPERWLELTVGWEGGRIVRVPAVQVAVRLPGTLRDFFRQRIRIEMGKVQMTREYPALLGRGTPQPRLGAALALGPRRLARLAAYLALREAAHVVAWWRWRRGAVAGVWRQAASTKRWDAA
jgi:Glycosyl transferase family 2